MLFLPKILTICLFGLIFVYSCKDSDSPLSERNKVITSFEIAGVSATIDEEAKTIKATLPSNTDLANLAPTIVLGDQATTISPSSGEAQDFTNPATYTVTAGDGTNINYTVTITVTSTQQNEIITSFEMAGVSATIDEEAKTIKVTLPSNTDLTNLAPTIVLGDQATTISPSSGEAQDFTNPVGYTVTAGDGTNIHYTVRITVTSTPQIITSFEIAGASATIDEKVKTIKATLPPGTDLTNLAPTIVLGDQATTISPSSGEAQDFTNPVTYTVTKQDNTQTVYTVTVTTSIVIISTTLLDFGDVTAGELKDFEFSITNHHTSRVLIRVASGPEGELLNQFILEKLSYSGITEFRVGSSRIQLEPSQTQKFVLAFQAPTEVSSGAAAVEIMYDLSVVVPGQAQLNLNLILNARAQPLPEPIGHLYVNHMATGANDGSSWENAHTSLSEALNKTRPHEYKLKSTKIWVAKGTYQGGFSIGSSVFLLGGFAGTETSEDQRDWVANRTILDGQGSSAHVMLISPSKVVGRRKFRDIVMDGFDITGGAAFNTINNQYEGGGIRIKKSRRYNVYVNNCRIYNNRSAVRGAAIYVSHQPVTFTNVLVTDNEGGADAGSNQRKVEKLYYLRGSIIHCNLSGLALDYKVRFINCTISGNRRGPHVNMDAGSANFIHVRASVEFINSIIWGSQEIVYDDRGGLRVAKFQHCIFQDPENVFNTSGNIGNVHTDPMLGSNLLMDACPGVGSPAIDAGKSVPEVTVDINNRSRSQGRGVDIGACEGG